MGLIKMSTKTYEIINTIDDGYIAKSSTSSGFNNTHVGLFFGILNEEYISSYITYRNIKIPQGAKINSARLDFVCCRDRHIHEIYYYIRGNNVDNAIPPTTISEFESLERTVSEVHMSNTNLTTGGQGSTLDISNIIQEIINRGGWQSGNDITIILDGDVINSEKEYVGYYSYDNTYQYPSPKLIIDYTKTVNYSYPSVCGVGKPVSYNYYFSCFTLSYPVKFIKSIYGNAVQLENKGLKLNTQLSGDYSIFVIRKMKDNNNFDWITLLSNGILYINGVLDISYNLSWLSVDINGNVLITNQAWIIDEILIIKEIVSQQFVEEWYNNQLYFYSDGEVQNYSTPNNVIMEVM